MSKPKKEQTPPTSREPLQVWTRYRVMWTFVTKVCGSVPGDPALIKKWLEAWQPSVKPAGAKTIEEINEEVLATIETEEAPTEFSLLVFQTVDGFIRNRAGTVRAHLKDCSRQLSALVGRQEGTRAFSTRVVNGLYVPNDEYWIPIRRVDGSMIAEPDGYYDKPIHVRDPRTGRLLSALKRVAYINPPSLMTFTLLNLGDQVPESDLHSLLNYGGVHGYGGERGDGEGRYEYTVERLAATTAEERPTTADGGRSDREARTDSGRLGASDDHREGGGANGPATEGDSGDRQTRTAVPDVSRQGATRGAGAPIAPPAVGPWPA